MDFGCLSHPKAQEYLNAGVIQELERKIKENTEYGVDDYSTYNEGLQQAIALLKGGIVQTQPVRMTDEQVESLRRKP